MRWLSAALQLIRWPNALLAAAAVLVGAWWAGARAERAGPVLILAAAAIALTALANAFNDAVDASIDAVAHPERPIPRGAIDRRTALVIAGVGAVSGIVLSGVVSARLALVSIVVAAAMVAYSLWIKRTGIAGNIVVAILASMPFLYGTWAAGSPSGAYPLLAFAIPLHFAREVAKDIDDVDGDRGIRATLPVRVGVPAARRVVALAALIFTAVVAAAPRLWPGLALPGLVALVPVAFGTWRALRGQRGSPRLMKAAMVAAIATLVVTLAP